MAVLLRFLRNRNSSSRCLVMANNTFYSSSAKNDKLEEELMSNPYYGKYAEKISLLQQTSPQDFLSKVESIKQKKKPKVYKDVRKFTGQGTAKPDITSVPYTKPKLLDSVMKLDLLKDKSADEIKDIWLEYHKSKDNIAAVISKDQYKMIYDRGQEFSTFLIPLPRNEGYEFILSQFFGHEIHFTPLISYQTHKENSPECLTIVHYTDIQDEKGIVLMKGEYNNDILSVFEAQCLANLHQMFYGQTDPKKLNLLQQFTYSPQHFKHMDLIAELECLSIK